MSFQIFLLVGHLTNWTGHNLLTDNTLKKRTQDVLVTCSVIVSDHNVKLAGHFQNLVGQCPMTNCYFQHCPDSLQWYYVNLLKFMIFLLPTDVIIIICLEVTVFNMRPLIAPWATTLFLVVHLRCHHQAMLMLMKITRGEQPQIHSISQFQNLSSQFLPKNCSKTIIVVNVVGSEKKAEALRHVSSITKFCVNVISPFD